MKTAASQRHAGRLRRHRRVRKKITGTADRPRLAVYRSNKHITVQVINDLNGTTIASASTVEPEQRKHELLHRGVARDAALYDLSHLCVCVCVCVCVCFVCVCVCA